MSSSVDSVQDWMSEYRTRFGAAPGAQDAKAELERCVSMCQELLADREQLRAELTQVKAERDQYLKSLYHYISKESDPVDYDKEVLLAEASREPSLGQIIEELERARPDSND